MLDLMPSKFPMTSTGGCLLSISGKPSLLRQFLLSVRLHSILTESLMTLRLLLLFVGAMEFLSTLIRLLADMCYLSLKCKDLGRSSHGISESKVYVRLTLIATNMDMLLKDLRLWFSETQKSGEISSSHFLRGLEDSSLLRL